MRRQTFNIQHSTFNFMRRGMSMIELLVVVAIMAILTTSLIAGYARFTSQNKVNAALQQIESALRLARNLAIANNHVYHVRLESTDLNSTIPNPDATDVAHPFVSNPNYKKPLDQQYIAINCFKDLSYSYKVNEQFQNGVIWNKSNNKAIENALIAPNASIIFEALPYKTYSGIQFLDTAVVPFDLVLSFHPDGSASQAMTYFVTDDPRHADDLSLSESAPANYIALQDDRINLNKAGDFAKNSTTMVRGTVKMLQVYIGGMIKVLPKVDTSVGTLKK